MIKGTTTTSTLTTLGLPIDTDLQSDIYLMDCMEALRQYPDNYFDLAVVDPPYGIGFEQYKRTNHGHETLNRFTKTGLKEWDEVPSDFYFKELWRVSKHQIIWGGNYFNLPPSKGFIFWYKQNPVPNFSDGEFAWSSFNKPARCFSYPYYGGLSGKTKAPTKIHPTQKPVALYDWTFKNYAEPGQKILDTHLGSGSSRIAAHKAGLNFTGFELDADYFTASEKRFKEYVAQTRLF